jgi:DNA-binding SARP family transcriptional activator
MLTMRLFGKFSVCYNDRPIEGMEPRKVQELLCYLLIYRTRPLARESLASLFWGETSTTQSKTYLRKALWQLQTALEPCCASGSEQLLLIDGEWVQVNRNADIYLDVAVIEEAFVQSQGRAGEELDESGAAAVRRAVELYQGDLLEGCYHDWCIYERERLQSIYLALLDKLMGYCESRGMYEQGLAYGAQILRYDRAREQTHRRLMLLHYLAGDRTAGIRQYQRCAASLEEELSTTPTGLTTKLYQQICANQFDAPAEPQRASCLELSLLSPALSGMLMRLRQALATLADLQLHIQQDIQLLEQALSDDRDRSSPEISDDSK